MDAPDSPLKKRLGIATAVILIYLVLTSTGVTWLWLLGTGLLLALPVVFFRGQQVRRYARFLLLIVVIAATVLARLWVAGLVVLVAALVFGVATKRVPLQYVRIFVMSGAPAYVGGAVLVAGWVWLKAGLPAIPLLLIPLLLAGLAYWQWRILRELWTAAG